MSLASPVSAPELVPREVHDRAVAQLRARYRSVPPGRRARLGKPTSNLFRFGVDSASAVRLDASGFGGVISVDPGTRTAEVQGMCTYEHLVDVTLAYGLMPLVVPQLRTITLGGAVTGLGIESSSFQHGLPHESVREMDVLVPTGDVVTATPDGEHADLFHGFANSYATLGYALRIVIDLQAVSPYVHLSHVRVPSASLSEAIRDACAADGDADFVDGVVFGRDEQYLTLARFTDDPGDGPSDYTGQQVFYRSVRDRQSDTLTTYDYIWRWDTDWFWCSAALGAQHPVGRRLWPRSLRRSDVYRRVVALDRRFRASATVRQTMGMPPEEPVIQDVEIPVDRLVEFLDAFHADVGIAPVWLCPVQLRPVAGEPSGARRWPLYPMEPGELYVNAGFWSHVDQRPGDPEWHNRRIEEIVADLGGHKSLYSTVHYDEQTFWEHYNGAAYEALKHRYDPAGRLPDLYRKVTGSGRA